WQAAEIALQASLGYGTYTVDVDSPLDDLDPNLVVGCLPGARIRLRIIGNWTSNSRASAGRRLRWVATHSSRIRTHGMLSCSSSHLHVKVRTAFAGHLVGAFSRVERAVALQSQHTPAPA